jgi:hypothetical protein
MPKQNPVYIIQEVIEGITEAPRVYLTEENAYIDYVQMANENGIEIPSGATKDQVFEAIKENNHENDDYTLFFFEIVPVI